MRSSAGMKQLFVKLSLMLAVLLVNSSGLFGQVVKSSPQKSQIFEQPVERMPEFPGGEEAMVSFIKKNLRLPADHIKGSVVVKFDVTESGELSDVKVIKSLRQDCDEEALRIIKIMPKWLSGRQNGKDVKVLYFSLPIIFGEQ